MQLVDVASEHSTAIGEFEAAGAAAVAVATGAGPAHIYTLYFDPGGQIGPHIAGFGQLLVPLTGSGWVAGADGVQFALLPGQIAYWSRGELHSKGSEAGMTALMIQVRDLTTESRRPGASARP